MQTQGSLFLQLKSKTKEGEPSDAGCLILILDQSSAMIQQTEAYFQFTDNNWIGLRVASSNIPFRISHLQNELCVCKQ